jgi:hypothetical protein
MLSNEAKLARLNEKKRNLEEAIFYTQAALNHSDYKEKFEFKNENKVEISTFQSEHLRDAVERLNHRNLGFDAELTIQHIEAEMLDQFNVIVKEKIKGKNIVTLSEMKHELELFLLQSRDEDHKKNLAATVLEIEGMSKGRDDNYVKSMDIETPTEDGELITLKPTGKKKK